MAEVFATYEDTNMRLNGTICMFKNKPVYVSVAERGKKDLIHIRTLSQVVNGREGKDILVSDKDFSYKSPPLGYIFYHSQALYLMRIPARQNQAGLTSGSLSCIPEKHGGFGNLLTSKEMEDCILGKHMTLEKALQRLKSDPEVEGVPIHRHVAIIRMGAYAIGLFYRGRFVGTFNVENERFDLLSSRDTSFIIKILQSLRLGINL